ncbi:MAG: GNAT family N-acetyltransferase [Vicinamibacterales bacterium]
MPKRRIAPLVHGRVRLRLLEEADLPMTLAWRNQDHIRQWFLNADLISAEQHAAWFRAYRDRDDDFVFVIEETALLNRPVGQVSLYHVDEQAGRAEFGRLMIGDEAAAGRGLAREATACLVNGGFVRWGLHEIYLDVKDDNAAAIAIYEKCGFTTVARAGRVQRMSVTRSSGAG